MPKEVNIDEILTRSHRQNEEKHAKKASQVIDSETGETVKEQTSSSSAATPFGFTGGNGLDGSFSEIFADPKLKKMFASGSIPGFAQLPLKQRLMFKIMGFFAKPGRIQLLRNKWLWPVWALILLILVLLAAILAFFFLSFKLLKALIMPYLNLFRSKS